MDNSASSDITYIFCSSSCSIGSENFFFFFEILIGFFDSYCHSPILKLWVLYKAQQVSHSLCLVLSAIYLLLPLRM